MAWHNYDYDDGDDEIHFADPGGRSALRAGKRDRACPSCGGRNRLTAEDVALGYQCDGCADQAEGRFGYGSAGDY